MQQLLKSVAAIPFAEFSVREGVRRPARFRVYPFRAQSRGTHPLRRVHILASPKRPRSVQRKGLWKRTSPTLCATTSACPLPAHGSIMWHRPLPFHIHKGGVVSNAAAGIETNGARQCLNFLVVLLWVRTRTGLEAECTSVETRKLVRGKRGDKLATQNLVETPEEQMAGTVLQ